LKLLKSLLLIFILSSALKAQNEWFEFDPSYGSNSYPPIICPGAYDTSLYLPPLPGTLTNGWAYFHEDAVARFADTLDFIITAGYDSVVFRFRFYWKANLNRGFMGKTQNQWYFNLAAASNNLNFFSRGNNTNKSVYTRTAGDTTWKTVRLKWNWLDSTMTGTVNDTAITPITGVFAHTAGTSTPFCIGNNLVTTTSEGYGTLPTSLAGYLPGGVDYVYIEVYDNGAVVTGFAVDFNQPGQKVWENYSRKLTDWHSLGITKGAGTNGAGGSTDTSDFATVYFSGSYTSQYNKLGNDGLFNVSADDNIITLGWSLCTARDSLLFGVGQFTHVNGTLTNPTAGTQVNSVFQLNLNTSVFSAVGTGVGDDYAERCMNQLDTAVIVSGPFDLMGGVALTKHIAYWNFTAWKALDSGFNDNLRCLEQFNNEPIAGGIFTASGGTTGINRIARWTGDSWLGFGTGMNNEVEIAKAFQGYLYAAGKFTTAGGTSVDKIARWNGSSWESLGLTFSPGTTIYMMLVYNNELYIGGDFTTVNGIPASLIAWNGSSFRVVVSYMDGYNQRAETPRILAMWIHKGLLYVGGAFLYINGILADHLFVTNGQSVCSCTSAGDLEVYQGISVRDQYSVISGRFNMIDYVEGKSFMKFTP
jgi:hypothetical protein